MLLRVRFLIVCIEIFLLRKTKFNLIKYMFRTKLHYQLENIIDFKKIEGIIRFEMELSLLVVLKKKRVLGVIGC